MPSFKSDRRLDFDVSSRGWCYILESEAGLLKSDFDQAQDLIGDCRKSGLLPLDIVAEDQAREFHCEETVHSSDVDEVADSILTSALDWWKEYKGMSFWENQDYYVQMLVEKIDLRSLFEPLCLNYRIRIANSKGWSDIGQRGNMMQRYRQWEESGKKCVLLYCGDHDPSGLRIPECLRDNLQDLTGAIGWSPKNLIIDRFGLNYDFIQKAGLTWIENLMTGSGKDLAHPNHPDHWKPYVQEYISRYGVQKCEANALVTQPQLGRQLCLDAILKYVSEEAMEEYEEETTIKCHKMKDTVENRFREHFAIAEANNEND